jgi:hypothetical protein
MSDQLETILRALFEGDEFPTPRCASCRNELAAFAETELAGRDAAARFPAVSAHLQECADCRQAHDELRALLSMELTPPPVAPHLDFGYLVSDAPGESGARSWRLDALGRLIVEFSIQLLQTLQRPTLQPGYLKGETPGSIEYDLSGQLDDLSVRIVAEPQRRDQEKVRVEVAVEIPSRGGWPNLAGSVVTLRRGEAGWMDVQETDAFGKVVFDGVPADDLASLRFEIEPA